jgi:RNA polymerase sigma factor (sigma-70 family)
MNSILSSHSLISKLEMKHFLSVQSLEVWQDVWELFCNDPWFQNQLSRSARRVVNRAGFDRNRVDDIQQEALVEFAKALQRDSSLGFDPTRGQFQGFLSTIIHRCCQKALRQFHRRQLMSLNEEFLHPFYDDQLQLEKIIDFHQLANEIPEPYRGVVRQVCDGLTIGEIARKRKRSKRTIYRWIDRSIELLQAKFSEEVDPFN